jgi:hypothetical protein
MTEGIMRYLLLSAVAAMLVVTAGCTDTMEPLGLTGANFEVLAQSSGGGEVCWYVASAHPRFNRHVVSWQNTFPDYHGADADTAHYWNIISDEGWDQVRRFPLALDLPAGSPSEAPLVAHVINLYKPINYEAENRVGTGYVVSVVEKKGTRTYNMFHQIVLQPWMGQGSSTQERDFGHNEGLCPEDQWKNVPICSRYACREWETVDGEEKCKGDNWITGEDGHVLCEMFVYRPACVGSFLGTSSMSCNKLPCDTRNAKVNLDFGTWAGFGTHASGNLNHGYEGVLREGTGQFASPALLFGWHHGSLCVQYDGIVQPPGPDPMVASFTYSCGNTDTCTFTDTSTGVDAAAYLWRFTNGSPDEDRSKGPVTVTYSTAGKHRVTLALTAGGTTATETGEVSCTSHPKFGIRCN